MVRDAALSSSRPRPIALAALVAMAAAAGAGACTRLNPAFDSEALTEGFVSDSESSAGDKGEGSSSVGPGDGDGDPIPETSGESESSSESTGESGTETTDTTDTSDPTDPTDPTDTTDTTDTGNLGVPMCAPALFGVPQLVVAVDDIVADNLIPFTVGPPGCVVISVCDGDQIGCNPGSDAFYRVVSGGNSSMGVEPLGPVAIQVNIGRTAQCNEDLMSFDASQILKLLVRDELDVPKLLEIPMPCVITDSVNLWIAEDGSAYWDPDLSDCAAGWVG